MKTTFALLLTVILGGLGVTRQNARAQGFTESDIVFYGEIRKSGGGQTVLLQGGHLKMTFVNQNNAANRVTLETELEPTGPGAVKPWSYALRVPLAYLPEEPRLDEFLSVTTLPTDFKIQEITIDGVPATLPDGSKEFYGVSFASRSKDYRLDLLVAGDSTDSDADGLPDWWELLYGLDPGIADSGDDSDGDGWSNLEEFRRGGNPTLSNRDPQLVTSGFAVPESGEAGVYVYVLDSDTPASGINLSLSGSGTSGFELRFDGVALGEDEVRTFPLTDLQAGRLTVRHTDRNRSQFALPVSWNDGGEEASGEVLLHVVLPSTEDGKDSSLWLDGMELTGNGGGISLWKDRSGQGHNASQPVASYRPVVASQSADFSASPNAHLFFQDLAIANGNHTVFASYQAAATSATAQTVLATNRGFLKLAPTAAAISYPGAPIYQMDGLAVRGFENAGGAPATSIFRREGNLLENSFGLSLDGQNIAAETIEPVLPTIGGRRSAFASEPDPVDEPFSGRLNELLVFPTALAEQKLRDVHDYLESKWGASVIWDLSTEVKSVVLDGLAGVKPQIIRGGHGDDNLGGGAADDTISGGPGADIMTGAGGRDRFVFGGLDTGADRITDFNPEADIIDLSALFWGKTGDARQFISIRLDTNFTTETPTLDSVLVVQRPTDVTQEIVLENTVIGSTQLVQLIVEGHVLMGGLSVPSEVQIALAAGESSATLTESLDQPFTIVATRSGAGVSAALDVPLGFFEDALGGRFVIDGASSNAGQRSVVSFARGQTSKTLTVRPIPDLNTSGATTVQVAVLPHYKYGVGGAPVERTITDTPMVWLNVVRANAVSSTAEPARVLVVRDGNLGSSLTVDLKIGGTAEEGVQIQDLPDQVTIPAGQDSVEVLVTALADGLVRGPKVVLFQLASRDRYQLGNPNEAVLYAATTGAEADGAGFDRWLAKCSNGSLNCLADLRGMSKEAVGRYLRAYAFGLDSIDDLSSHHVTFRIADGKPELLTHGSFKAADVRWGVESTASLDQWSDSTSTFTEAEDATGFKLVGQPLPPEPSSRFYRMGVSLDHGRLATNSITELTGSSLFGVSGTAEWKTNQATGGLVTSGGTAGDTSRIIVEVSGDTSLDFEMQVSGGGADDRLVFYIDGVKQSETSGAAVVVQQELSGSDTHLLMWEFKQGTGNAVITNRNP